MSIDTHTKWMAINALHHSKGHVIPNWGKRTAVLCTDMQTGGTKVSLLGVGITWLGLMLVAVWDT